MTSQLERRFKKFPLYSQEGKGDDAIVVAKFFCSWNGWVWYVTEGKKGTSGDWIFFGKVVEIS